MNRSTLTDIFPVRLSEHIPRLSYHPRDFRTIQASDIRAFVVCMSRSSEKIYFQKRQFKEKYVTHVPFVAKCSRHCSEFRPDDIDWGQVKRRFCKPVMDTQRKNMDMRVGYMIGENTYLVKVHFTFGQRTVAPGTAHVYQLLEVPLIFYSMDKKRKPLPTVERRLPYQDIHLFDRNVLAPNRCYRIPAGTTYVILSTQKNYFRVDVVRDDAVLPFETRDPLRCKETVPNLYPTYLDKCAPTPFIGAADESDGEEDSSQQQQQQQQQQPPAPRVNVGENVVGQPMFDWVFFQQPQQPQQQQQQQPRQEEQEQQQQQYVMEPVYFQQVVREQQQQQQQQRQEQQIEDSVPEALPEEPSAKRRREEEKKEEEEEEDVVVVKKLFAGNPPVFERNVVVVAPKCVEFYQTLKMTPCNADPKAPADPEMIICYDVPQQEEPVDMTLNENERFDRMMRDFLKECPRETADGVIRELFAEKCLV